MEIAFTVYWDLYQCHDNNFHNFGSCELKGSVIECWSMPLIDKSTSVKIRSTLNQHIGWQSVKSWLICDWCMSQSCLIINCLLIECLDQVSIVMLNKFQSSVDQEFHRYWLRVKLGTVHIIHDLNKIVTLYVDSS